MQGRKCGQDNEKKYKRATVSADKDEALSCSGGLTKRKLKLNEKRSVDEKSGTEGQHKVDKAARFYNVASLAKQQLFFGSQRKRQKTRTEIRAEARGNEKC